MKIKHFSAGRASRPVLFLVLTLLFASACGLGLDTQARLDRAETAFADGDYRAAIIDAKNILQEEPDNLAARLVLGRASVEIGDGASAEKEFRRALDLGAENSAVLVDLGRALVIVGEFDAVLKEIDPELVEKGLQRNAALRLRGDALIGLHEPGAAREQFTEVLNENPDDLAAHIGVVRSYISENNYLQAREVLRGAIELDESHIPTWLTSGSLAIRTGDHDRAVEDFTRAATLALQAKDVAQEMAALKGQADAELGRQNIEAARSVLDRMNTLGGQDSRTLMVSARIAVADKNLGKAQADLQEVLRRAPENRFAQMLLGYVHKEGGNLRQAEMYLSAVVASMPGNADARRLLAETRIQLNKSEEAKQALAPLLTAANADIGTLSLAADASRALGDFDGVTTLLERAVAASPDDANLRIQLVLAYLRSDEPAKAQEMLENLPESVGQGDEFKRDSLLVLVTAARGTRDAALDGAVNLVERWPGRFEAHALLGSIETSMGNYGAARASFERASDIEPGNVQAIRYLAYLDEVEENLLSATKRYELILELEPKNLIALLGLARLSFRNEDYDKAVDWLQQANSSHPDAVEPRQLLGSFFLASKQFAAAEEVISEALELAPENSSLLSMLGIAQLNQENWRDAEFNFSQALERQPDEPWYRLNMAKSQAQRGNRSSAITTLQDNLEQTLQHLPSGVYLASLKSVVGDFDGARVITNELKRRFPESAIPHALDGELLARSGDLIGGSRAYDDALKIDTSRRFSVRAYQLRRQAGIDGEVEPLLRYLELRPFDSSMRVYLAEAYQALDETVNAILQYETVLRDEPDNFVAANNLAWSYYETGDSQAEEMARNAYRIEPNSGAIADTLGWILVEKGSVKEGIEFLRRADELSDGRADIRYHLAAALAADGQIGSAKFMLQEILQSQDDFANRKAAEKLLSTL